MKKILLLIGGAVLLVVTAVVVTYIIVSPDTPPSTQPEVVEEEEVEVENAAEEETGEFEPGYSDASVYHEFHPNFVVNITDDDKSRYLAIDLAVVAQSQAAIDALKIHMPALRNDLNFLLSSQKAAELRTTEGKEALRKQALNTIRKVMTDKYGDPAIENVYFNKFVIQ